jgi:hypothetical protein
VRGGIKGYLGLDEPANATDLGREAYRQAQALGNMPGIGAPAGAFKAAAKFGPEMAMFIGAMAKTWDKASNAKAVQLEKAGTDARSIWEQTGNWRGPDGEWRQEISDVPAYLRASLDAAAPTKANNYGFTGLEGPLAGVFTHNELYAAYPDLLTNERMILKKAPDWMPAKVAESGAYTPSRSYRKGNVEVKSKTEKGAKSLTLHELQHAVQNREKWQRGGSEMDFGLGEEAFQKYLRLSGEAEARATQARQNLTPAQRRALFPEESYDVPINQLIIKK